MKKRKRMLCLIALGLLLAGLAVCGLTIPPEGAANPVARGFYTQTAIWQLEREIDFTGEDIVITVLGGDGNVYLESFEIHSRETADMLFDCMRRSIRINDLTNTCFSAQPPPYLLVEGQLCGDFSHLYLTHRLTGKYVAFRFSPEDAAAFEAYVTALAENVEPT